MIHSKWNLYVILFSLLFLFALLVCRCARHSFTTLKLLRSLHFNQVYIVLAVSDIEHCLLFRAEAIKARIEKMEIYLKCSFSCFLFRIIIPLDDKYVNAFAFAKSWVSISSLIAYEMFGKTRDECWRKRWTSENLSDDTMNGNESDEWNTEIKSLTKTNIVRNFTYAPGILAQPRSFFFPFFYFKHNRGVLFYGTFIFKIYVLPQQCYQNFVQQNNKFSTYKHIIKETLTLAHNVVWH